MTEAAATIVTTPYPMHGYEDDVLGGNYVFSRLNAVHSPGPPLPTMRHFTTPASYRGCRRHFYVKALQASVIDWYDPPRIESGMNTADAPEPECDEGDYLRAVHEVCISYLLAHLKAQAKGELSRPIVLHGRSQVGRTADLRSGMWIVQSKGKLNRLQASFGFERDPIVASLNTAQAASFLDDVYRLVDAGDLQSATDRVFDHIDRLLCENSFDICDTILQQVDVERLPTALMRSFLTITAPAKDHLPSRQPLFERIEQEMMRQKGPEMTQRLIGRLA